MTKKDYELIAASINKQVKLRCFGASDGKLLTGREDIMNIYHALQVVAEDLADALAHDNPRFNRTKFLEACGISED